MAEDTVGKSDLRDVRDSIIEEMRHGFTQVHDRLDRADERMRRLEQHDAAKYVEIQNLKKVPSVNGSGGGQLVSTRMLMAALGAVTVLAAALSKAIDAIAAMWGG